jgi:hypothetical protein
MAIFDAWCDFEEKKDKRKRLWTLVEKDGVREEVQAELADTMRSHYDRLDRIADGVNRLGYGTAAKILKAVLPQGAKARSGDLGEILATEIVEEKTGFTVPTGGSATKTVARWPCEATTSSVWPMTPTTGRSCD